MAYCEHCGYRIPRGEEDCPQCGHLDFSYVDDGAKPVDPEQIRWAERGEYVLETTCTWSTAEYIAIEDPDDVDGVFAHEPDVETPSGLLGLVPLLRRGDD